MSMVGSIYRQLGRFDSAIEWHEKALELRIEVLGEDHIGLSSDLIAIGHIHYCQRELDLSLAAFSEYTDIQNRSLPNAGTTDGIADPGLLASIWYKMGQICMQLEDGPNAKKCYEGAVDVARSALVGTASDTREAPQAASTIKVCAVYIAKALYKLALVHRIEGDICTAIACAEEAIQYRLLDESMIGISNDSTSTILSFVMRLYEDKGDAAKVQMYYQKISELETSRRDDEREEIDMGSRPYKWSRSPCALAAWLNRGRGRGR